MGKAISKYLLILLVLLCHTQLKSQELAPVDTYLIDSLDLSAVSEKDKELIESSLENYRACETDICKVRAISKIVEDSWDANIWPKYNRWVHDFIEQSIQQPHDSATLVLLKKSYAGALNNIGYLYNIQGKNDLALAFYEKCLNIQEEVDDKPGMSGTLINSGYIFLNQGLIEKALEYYYASLSIEEEIGNQTGIATALNGIGYILYKQGDNEKALESYTQSLVIRRELKDDYGIATCLNNIGLLFRDQKEWNKALSYYEECLTLQEKLADKSGIAISLNNIAFILKEQGQLSKAYQKYNESLKLSKEASDQSSIATTLNSLGSLELLRGNVRSAQQYATESLNIANRLKYPAHIRDASETLMEIARKQSRWKEALEHYEVYIQMRDSVFNEETIAASINERFKYNYEKKALADSIKNADEQRILDAELAASQAKQSRLSALAKKQKLQLYFLIITVVVVLIFILIINNRMRTIKEQKRIIEEQNIDLKKHKTDLEYLNDDLAQFAHTVSHDLKTPLVGIMGVIQLLEIEYPDLEETLKERLDLIRDSALKSNDLITGILEYSEAGRGNAVKENVDVNKLLKSSIDEINNKNNINITIASELPTVSCNKYQFKQILTNLISNAIKYNHRGKNEGRVTIEYTFKPGFHEFTVADNGPGIPKNQQTKVFEIFKKAHSSREIRDSSGVGLSIVKKLVTQNGGAITLDSEEGKGASFKFTWPMEP